MTLWRMEKLHFLKKKEQSKEQINIKKYIIEASEFNAVKSFLISVEFQTITEVRLSFSWSYNFADHV